MLLAFRNISPLRCKNDLQDNLILLKGVLLSLDKCRFYRYDDKVSRGGPFIPFDFANAHKSWVKLQKSIDVKEAEKLLFQLLLSITIDVLFLFFSVFDGGKGLSFLTIIFPVFMAASQRENGFSTTLQST